MQVRIKRVLAVVFYKGHTIRKVEDWVGNERTFIDMPPSETFEDAPILKQVYEYEYASIADAKRAINGKPMKFAPVDMIEVLGGKYLNRNFNN
jgi:hypothetical protein